MDAELTIHLTTKKSEHDWMIMAVALLLFVFVNPILGVFYKKKWLRYTGLSVASLIVLSATLYISTNLISTVPLHQSQPNKLMLITTIIFYLMLVMISGFYRMVILNLKNF